MQYFCEVHFAICLHEFLILDVGFKKLTVEFLQSPPDWPSILAHFRGSELQNYFTKILEDNLKAVAKPQYVDQIPK